MWFYCCVTGKFQLHYRIFIATINAIWLVCSVGNRCFAADWGYDEGATQQHSPQPLHAQAQPISKASKPPAKKAPPAVSAGSKYPAAKTVTATRTPAVPKVPGAPVSTRDTDALIEECWAQIYELAGRQKLDSDQRAQLNALVKGKLAAAPAVRQDARSVLIFWPKLTAYLVAHADQSENYASLIKALLRYKARNESGQIDGKDNGGLAADECALISEVLGAQRLSVPGTVPFSEDAVNAYADMACFIYEQSNPGKSVDAMDNRAVFATVVSEKFKQAPTKKDQEAMAGFDLSWAKFKIVWTQADEKQRAALLANLKKSGAGAAWAQAHDSMLELVLNNWPGAIQRTASVVSDGAEAPHK